MDNIFWKLKFFPISIYTTNLISSLKKNIYIYNFIQSSLIQNTSFWSDSWLEGGMLWDRFRRLFELSVNPDVSVTAMRRDSWKVDGVGWRWRRRLFAWEEEHIFA